MLNKIKKYYLLNGLPLISCISIISLIVALCAFIFIDKEYIYLSITLIGICMLILCMIPFIDLFFNISKNHYNKIDIETFDKLNSENSNFLNSFFYYKNIDFLIQNYSYFIKKSNIVIFYYLREVERKAFYSDLLKFKEFMAKEHLIRVLLNFEKNKLEVFENEDFIQILKEIDKNVLYKKYEETIKYVIKHKIIHCYDNIIELFENFDNDDISVIKYNRTKILEKDIVQKEIKVIQI